MSEVNVHDAKTRLSQLLHRAEAGEEIVIARAGKPVVRLVPVGSASTTRPMGQDAGRVRIASDFDAPLPARILRDFER